MKRSPTPLDVHQDSEPLDVELLEPRVLLAADLASGLEALAPEANSVGEPVAEVRALLGELPGVLGRASIQTTDSIVRAAGVPPALPVAVDLAALGDLYAPTQASTAGAVDAGIHPAARATPGAVLATTTVTRHEVVFVDATVPDHEQLVADLSGGAASGRNLEVVLIDPDEDGITQINRALAQYDDLGAIHIVSHGEAGALRLGATVVDLATLQERSDEVRGWGTALSDTADLLLYGCELAASESGRAVADAFSELTGADVAASDDLTGAAALGGDWELEYRSGAIETNIAFDARTQAHWSGVLDYVQASQAWSPTSVGPGVWETKDLSAYGVPANAVAEIAVANGATSLQAGGVRAVGSSLDRSFVLEELFFAGQGAETTVMHVQTDGASSIETHATDLSGITFTLLGYWENGTYVERFDAIPSLPSSGTWEGVDLSAYGVGAADVVEITMVNDTLDDTTTEQAGVRAKGSSLERLLDLDDAGTSNPGAHADSLMVQADGTGTIEAYASDKTRVDFHLVGYWSDPPSSYTEAFDTLPDTATDTWETADLSSFGVSAGAIADITLTHEAIIVGSEMGAREPGTPDRLLDLRASHSASSASMHVKTDGASNIELYHEGGGAHSFTLTGFWSNAPPAITSDGGGATAGINVIENSTVVTTVAATDPDTDPVTYYKSGGTDQGFFSVDLNSGVLTFDAPPDFENPLDGGANNTYEVEITADDGNGGTDIQTITVTVTDVAQSISATGASQVNAGALYTLNLSATDNVTGWTINWGDGAIDTVVGDPGSVTHTYSAAGFTNNITVSATDASGDYLDSALLIGNAASGTDGFILSYGYDPATGKADIAGVQTLNTPTPSDLDWAADVVVGPDGHIYGTGYQSGNIVRFDGGTGAFIDELVTTAQPVSLAFGPDGHIYVASDIGNVKRFDGSSGAYIDTFLTLGYTPEEIEFGPDGNLYVGAYTANKLYRYDGVTGAPLDGGSAFIDPTLTGPTNDDIATSEQFAFGPDGNIYVASQLNGKIQRYSGVDGTWIDTFATPGTQGTGNPKGPTGVAFGPDGHLYVTRVDKVMRYDGTSGAYIDDYVPAGGAIDKPWFSTFTPQQQVKVVANSAPTLGNGALTAVLEETATPTGETVATIFTGQFSDGDPGSSFGGVAVVGNGASPVTEGTWQYSSNGGTNWYDLGTVGDDATALALDTTTLVRFVPVANFDGVATSLVVRGLDNTYVGGFSTTAGPENRISVDTSSPGGTTPIAATAASLSTTITPVGDTPVAPNVVTLEDNQSGDIVLDRNAADGAEVTHFKITNVSGGTLYQNDGTTVINAGDFITYAQGNAGLKFTPSPNSTAAGSFDVESSEDGTTVAAQSSVATSTITVTPVGDTPVAPNVVTLEDTQSGDIVLDRNAADGAEVTHFKITNISGGTLYQNDGTTVINAGDFITYAQGNAGLKFTPSTNSTAAGSFDVESSEDGATVAAQSGVATSTVTVTPVGDTPVAPDIVTLEDTQTSDIVLDRHAADGAEVTHFKITNISGGTLYQNDGTTVINAGDFITYAQGNAGLKFTPSPNSTTAGSFDVESSQDGTTVAAQSGVATSTVTVTPVGDTPVAPNIVTLEDTQSGDIVLDGHAADGPEVTHFKITNISGGTLYQNDGTTVINAGDFITYAQGNAGLKFTPIPNSTAAGSFDVESSEDGATVAAQSGVATSTVTVTPVGDTPVAPSIVTLEDTQSGDIVLDRNAADGAEVTHFKITNISGGTLYQNDGTTVVNAGDFITYTQGNAGLKFTPIPNSTAAGSFDVESSEDGATVAAQSGVATSTVTVTPVGDTPVAPSIVTLEDTQSGDIVLDRHAADGAEVTHFKITNIAGGTLYQNDGTTVINAGDFITYAQGNAGLKFTPSPNSTTAGSFDVESSEDGTTVAAQSGVATSTITVTPVGDTPVAPNIVTLEDTQSGDIVLDRHAADGPEVTHFKITSISGGTLYQNDGTTVINAGDFITYAQGNAGLKFTPSPNSTTAGSFDVESSEDGTTVAAQSGVATSTVTVTPVGDTPVAPNVVTLEDTQSGDIVLDRNASDGAEVTHFKITNISGGTLYQNDGTTVINAGDFITYAQGNAGLKFTPSPNSTTAGSFDVESSEDGTTVAVQSGVATSTNTVTPVGDTPVAPNIVTLEDTQTSDIVLDRHAADGPEVTHFKITSISGGTLYQNDGTTVINAGDFITYAQGNAGLKFTPSPNSTTAGSFDVESSEDGTTVAAQSGVATSTVTVTPVGDTPVAPNVVTLEDTQSGDIVLDRNASDGAEVTHFKITNISGGTLYQNDGTTVINAGDFITYAQGNAGLKFTPSPNSTTAGSFDVESSEDGTTVAVQSGVATSTNTVTPVGDTPVAPNIVTLEDTQTSDIVLDRHAADGPEVTHFKITSISGGTLYQNDGTTVINAGDFITYAQGNAGLKFTPSPNSTTAGSFDVESSEDGTTVAAQSGVATSTVTVTPVGDTPVAPNVVTLEDTQSGDIVLDRNASDGAEVTHFKITNISGGTLYQNDGTTVINAGDFIIYAQGNAGLKFTPSPNSTTAGSFDVESSEDGTTVAAQSGVATSTVTVTPVGDTPVATNIVTLEDTQTSDIVLDRHAADGPEVTHFKITSISGGTLYQNDGTTVINAGDFITYAEGNAGLKFTPSPDLTTDGSFDVESSEDGTTVAAQSSVATSTITVTPVGDTPVAPNIVTLEDTQSGDIVLDRNASDGAEVTHFKITNISGGTLYQNDGTTVINAGDFITYAQGNAGLKFTPSPNSTAAGSFDVESSEDGTTVAAQSGVATSTITVTPVGDTPVATNIVTLEDTQTSDIVLDRHAADGPEVTHFKITSISGGTLYQNDGTTVINAGDFITYAQGNAGLKFTPSPNSTTAGSFDIESSEDGTTVAVQSGVATSTITVTPVGDTPVAPNVVTLEDTQTSDIVLDRHAADGPEVTHFKITNIAGGTLYQNDGTTVINAGDFITYAQGNAGLKFTPSPNSITAGSFDVESSEDGTTVAVQSGVATSTITVTPVGDTPVAPNVVTLEDTQSGDIVLDRHAADGAEVTHFKITNIAGGTLYQNDGTTVINAGDFITYAQGNAGLKFTPSPDSTTAGSFDVESSENGTTVAAQSGVATSTVTVTPVGDTPVAPNVVTLEDTQSGDIVLDRNAADGTEVTHFKITNIAGGTLYQNDGTTVINAGDFITYAQGTAGLKFTPSPDLTTAGSFDVESSEDGTTVAAQSGVAASTVTVTPVGDTPVAPNVVTLEDTQSGTIVLDRNAADGAEVTHFKITSISGGTLYQNDGTTVINAGDFITYAQGNAGLKFTPSPDSTTDGSFDVESSEDGTTVAAQSGVATSTITVTPVGDTPVAPNIVTLEDAQSGDIVLDRNAADGAEVTHFKITNIAGGTVYQNDGTTVINTGDFITYAQGNAGLKFTPSPNSTAAGSFDVESSEDGTTVAAQSSVAASTVTVTPVGDTPVAPNVVTLEDTQSGTIVLDRNAADGAEVTHFKITSISGGTLYQNDGTTVINAGDFITYAQGNAGLKFTPSPDSTTDGSFDVESSEDGTTVAAQSGVATSTITVTPVGDTPVAPNVVTLEDAQSGDIVLDRNAADGAEVTHFKITNIAGGTLYQNDGTTVINAGDFITYAQGNAGLKFTPSPNSTSAGSFDVASSEDGTTVAAQSGVATSTVTVTPVGDTPVAPNVVTLEDTQSGDIVLDRNAADGAEVTHFKITNISGGTLYQNDGTTVINAGDFITYAQGNAGLKFTPSPNSTAAGSFDVESSEDGATVAAQSGVASSTVSITPVGDTPVAPNVVTLEDAPSGDIVLARNAADGAEVTHFKITNISGGTLYQNDGTTVINAGDFITYAQGNAGLKFTPSPNSTAAGSFDVESSEDGTTVAAQSGVATSTVTVTPVGDTPVAPNIVTLEDTQSGDIVLDRHAADGPEVTHFKVTNISGGTLYQNDGTTVVNAGDFITYAQGNAGLKFTPSPDSTTAGSFDVESSEDGTTVAAQSGVATSTTTVTPVNDAPAATDNTVATLADTAYSLVAADFGFTDPTDGDALLEVKITTPPGAGTLANNAVVLSAGDTVSAADIAAGRLVFTPAAGASGAGYASFTFQVRDDGGIANGGVDLQVTPNSLTFDVNAPAVVATGPITTPPVFTDRSHTVTPTELGLATVAKDESDTIVTVLVAPRTGTFSLGGSSITGGEALQLATIDAGTLEFIPPLGHDGIGQAAFAFEALDSGVPRRDLQADGDLVPGPRSVAQFIDVTLENAFTEAARLALDGLAGRIDPGERIDLDDLTEHEDFRRALDRLQVSVAAHSLLNPTAIGSMMSVAGLSIGYIAWLARGGVLVASFISSLPVWRVLDPIPVLAYAEEDEETSDGESLESMIEDRAGPHEPNPDVDGTARTPPMRA